MSININTIRFKEFDKAVPVGNNEFQFKKKDDTLVAGNVNAKNIRVVGYRILNNGISATDYPEMSMTLEDLFSGYTENHKVTAKPTTAVRFPIVMPEEIENVEDCFTQEHFNDMLELSRQHPGEEDLGNGYVVEFTTQYTLSDSENDVSANSFTVLSWLYIPTGGGGSYGDLKLCIKTVEIEGTDRDKNVLALISGESVLSYIPLDFDLQSSVLKLMGDSKELCRIGIQAGMSDVDLYCDGNKTVKVYDRSANQPVGTGLRFFFGEDTDDGTLKLKIGGNEIGSWRIPAGEDSGGSEATEVIEFNPVFTGVEVADITTGTSSGEFVEDTAYEALHPEISRAYKLNLNILTLQGETGETGEQGPQGEDGEVPEIRFNVNSVTTGIAGFTIGTGTPNADNTIVTYDVDVVLPDGGGGGSGTPGLTPVLRNVYVNDPSHPTDVFVADSTYTHIYDLYLNIAAGPQGETGATGATGPQGPAGKGITSIAKTGTSGNVDTYTITYTDNTTSTYTVTNGANGRGISYINGPSSSGNTDTYTIVYTDGTTSTYSVTNGHDGINGLDGKSINLVPTAGQNNVTLTFYEDVLTQDYTRLVLTGDNVNKILNVGVDKYVAGTRTFNGGFPITIPAGRGIASIAKTSTNGNVDTYTITYSDNTTSTYTVINGLNGVAGSPGTNGTDGVGISSITGPVTSGRQKTYTINLTNGTSYPFTVTDGAQGTPGTNGTNGIDGTDGTRFKLYRVTLNNAQCGQIVSGGCYPITYSTADCEQFDPSLGIWNSVNEAVDANYDAMSVVDVCPDCKVASTTAANVAFNMSYGLFGVVENNLGTYSLKYYAVREFTSARNVVFTVKYYYNIDGSSN